MQSSVSYFRSNYWEGVSTPLLLKIKRDTTAHFLKSLFGIKQALIFQEFNFFVKV